MNVRRWGRTRRNLRHNSSEVLTLMGRWFLDANKDEVEEDIEFHLQLIENCVASIRKQINDSRSFKMED